MSVKPWPYPGEDVDHFVGRVKACWASGECRTEHAITRARRLGRKRWLLTGCIEFKPQDVWIGAFWKKSAWLDDFQPYDLWICLIPCFPIHLWWYRRVTP